MCGARLHLQTDSFRGTSLEGCSSFHQGLETRGQGWGRQGQHPPMQGMCRVAEVRKWPRVWAQQDGAGVGKGRRMEEGVGRSQEVKSWGGRSEGQGCEEPGLGGGVLCELRPPAGPELSAALLLRLYPPPAQVLHWALFQASESQPLGLGPHLRFLKLPRCV